MLRHFVQAAIALSLIVPSLAMAQMEEADSLEISAVSGFYQSSKVKNNGSNGGGQSKISIGGRVHQFTTEDQQWFAYGGLAITTFDAPSGGKAPDNSTSITLLGGYRQFFTEFSQVVIPYLSVYGGYMSDKSATASTATAENATSGFTETETSGLYYYGAVGFRFDVAANTFFEIEAELFQSALFGTTTTKNGDSKSETTTTDLFVNTTGALDKMTIAVGMEI
ncbi:hypothetical protein N9D31_01725 [Oligoflexaceae bacterium]|nr:hypothetical protein [Oligoflexaceae bacterium]